MKWLPPKKKKVVKCPDCGGEIVYYRDRQGLIRIGCANKCVDYKMLRESNKRGLETADNKLRAEI